MATRPATRALFLGLLLQACSESTDLHQTDGSTADPVVGGPDGGRLPDGGQPAGSTPDAGQPVHADPGTTVTPSTPAEEIRDLTALRAALTSLDGLTPADLLARHPVTFSTGALGYDARSAQGMSLIQASPFKLTDAELAKLAAQGFVITPRNQFPNMGYGLVSIYAADLPVYVSLDAILDAVHQSYDAILKAIETVQLIDDMRTLLTDARTRLAAAGYPADVRGDLDVFLTVGLSLLETQPVAPLDAANAAKVNEILASARAADSIADLTLFGVERDFDYSQLKPRGHYTDSEALSRYFRATMWLGRTDFRMIETLPDGTSVFRRRQLEAVTALTSLVTGSGRAAYDRIDAVVSAFVGEHDYMTVPEVEALYEALGTRDLSALPDDTIVQAILDGGFGAQRISSQVLMLPPGGSYLEPLPLSRSFALLGQRFVVDSFVFSNVVFDRVAPFEKRKRMLPKGLDVAYAALGNAAALPLLEGELTRYDYATELETVRSLVEAHGDAYWDANLYTLWLSALRALSPEEGAQTGSGRPALTESEAWHRRLLNTQLGSWAELRHDTILYAKQSYSAGVACEFPDGYVDPYPEAFARLEAFARKGASIAALLENSVREPARVYFEELEQVSATLRTMAEQELTGTPFDAAQMAFLNDAVRTQVVGCGGPVDFQGWYARLLYSKSEEDMDPTIADVHTNPGDNAPPEVLYAATGLPRLMVVTRETCSGPRAYAGVAFAYHEFAQGLPRINDLEWAPRAKSAPDTEFVQPILP